MADLLDHFPGLLFDVYDPDNGMNLDLVPLDDGGIQVRIFAPGKATTSRSVVLDAALATQLQLAIAGHLRADELRGRIAELDDELVHAKARLEEQAAQLRRLTATPELRRREH